MKSKYKMLSVVAAVAMGFGLLSQQAYANPSIVGDIDLTGTATVNGTGSGIVLPNNFKVGYADGDYGIGLTPTWGQTVTTFNPFNWTPPATGYLPLWSFTYAGTSYAFLLNLATVTDTLSDDGSGGITLAVDGSGYAFMSGKAPTLSLFAFSIDYNWLPWDGSQADALTEISGVTGGVATINTSVPDGGLTVALLGFAMVGLEGLRRKQSK